MRPPSLYRTA